MKGLKRSLAAMFNSLLQRSDVQTEMGGGKASVVLSAAENNQTAALLLTENDALLFMAATHSNNTSINVTQLSGAHFTPFRQNRSSH